MFKTLVFILVLLLFGAESMGQEVSGILINENKRSVEGAYVYNTSSGSHAHSNALGIFRIQRTHVGDTLEIGSLGYEKILFQISEPDFRKQLKFIMKEAVFELNEFIIRPEINALSALSEVDLKTQPVRSSQEILQKVPGLFIGQHAGGGKAEQLFLRGFDIDHGTDIAITVDNMPVNMVSHAHGQGYSDLHFVIPETLQKIDFDKGPHQSGRGNFATAGYVDFKTKDRLPQSFLQLEYGDFGWNRNLGMFNIVDRPKQHAYLATELLRFDGPFESSQNFSRINLFGKYSVTSGEKSRLSATASHFTSTWDASGQIPQRAVDQGIINRFGAIDDTEGGSTSRSNINFAFVKELEGGSIINTNAFWSRYDFELFSNFTFFLENPENGDQIRQRETRNIFGVNATWSNQYQVGVLDVGLRAGTGFRNDLIEDNELSKTANRKDLLANVQLGDVNEINIYNFLEAKIRWNKLVFVPGIRLDHFQFGYSDSSVGSYNNEQVKSTLFSPKFSLLYNPDNDLQVFLKSGVGFHSNDTRVVVAQKGNKILPKAYGVDLGAIYRPGSPFVFNLALWYLHLEQEFVYVGDAGIVEPSGRTRRYGLDMGLRYQIYDWLFFNTDATYSRARSLETNNGNNFVPLAPDLTVAGGLAINGLHGFSGGLRYRYLDDRPANEDNSIVAEGYFVVDMSINYALSQELILGIGIQNLFNTEWNETQFATNSQLQNEPQAVEEIHFTPGVPFFLQVSIRYAF